MRIAVGELARAVGGQIQWADMPPREGAHTAVGNIVIDSRQVQPGDVFWALQGQSHHGAQFATEALMRGAVGVVTDRPVAPLPGCFSVLVPDTRTALWELAGWHRQHLEATVVAVTGSVGKTTARQMIHTVLAANRRGVASEANYNNHLGVPLSVLRVGHRDNYAVLELGASARGEIQALTELTEPDIGVVTGLGDAHLQGFGSREGIVAGKAELPRLLGSHACAILPGDDPRMRAAVGTCEAEITWFGRLGHNDVTASGVDYRHGQLRFQACDQWFEIPVWGRHHLHSALAAISVARLFGQPLSEIAEALAQFQSMPMRCEVLQLGEVIAINDTYNACPVSMKAALALLQEFGNSRRRIVAVGDMKELGDEATGLHRQLGQQVVTVGSADRLAACGEHAEHVAKGAHEAGMPVEHIATHGTATETAEFLIETLQPGDVVLAKGSRAMQMERVVQSLAQHKIAQVA
jgi:UDP-N-acetylmuramoyl-tripeptide--D-alanyl-D-alanine ligase